ncbi:hypothetical protein Q4Q35_01060 [Flavivirga aquimarina]|uniref:DUF7793 domain-containing protein n=1 Tax=Flavivirga aquimarina TaxID=2027862 RepID=A0ABT8W5J3_9FLAO|nr:hypothetical protein [Flavivirga aquimarina]MDO5968385.1 hypothetical protein [Flavivirga aquimarina]
MANHIENEYSKFWIEKDILHFVYKKGVEIDLEVAKKIVSDRLALQQGKSLLILCDIRGIKSVNKEARNYFAIEGSTLLKVVALLVNSPLTYTISGFYIKTSSPSIITKAFTTKEAALKFLNDYKPV